MIGERLALAGATGTAIVIGGLCLSLQLGKMGAEKDRDTAVNWAANVCAVVGKPWRDDPAKPGKFIAKAKWGKDCETEIRRLVTNASNAAQTALTAVTAHDTEQTAKAAVDRPAARRSTARIQTGQHQMEVAIATAQDGHLGPDYFDGLNRSLGLRPYQDASAPAAPDSVDAEGAAVAGPAEVQ